MKSKHFFPLILLGIALGVTFLVQDYALTNEMNQTSLNSDLTETITTQRPVVNYDNYIEQAYFLPVIKVGDKLMPHLVLPVVYIESNYLEENIFPTKLLDGKYVADVTLDEVNITAI